MGSFSEYLSTFYGVKDEVTQGCILFFDDSFQIEPPVILLQRSVPRSNPPAIIDPVGIVVIENECDLVEEEHPIPAAVRYRKTATVEFLYVYDASDFLAPLFASLKAKKQGSTSFERERRGLLRFLENADIDNMNFYLPFHPLFGSFKHGLVVYCKKSQVLSLDQLPNKGKFACLLPPHREKLRNYHLKYDLRVPTMELQSLDILRWIVDPEQPEK